MNFQQGQKPSRAALGTAERSRVEELISRNVGLVHLNASSLIQQCPPTVSRDDLYTAGMEGLFDACLRFDETRASFSTFAWQKIRFAMLDYLRAEGYRHRHRGNFDSVFEADTDDRGGDHDAEAWLIAAARRAFVGDLLDTRESDALDQLRSAARTETAGRLHAAVDRLPADQREVIRAKYFEHCELQTAAERLGVHKSTATRLHARALDSLAKALRDGAAEPSLDRGANVRSD